MARKISISFKETTKDIQLYTFLDSLEDKSADIKKALREYYKKELSGEEKILKKEEKPKTNILDF